MISEERLDRMGLPPLAKARMFEAYTIRIGLTGKWRQRYYYEEEEWETECAGYFLEDHAWRLA